MEEIIIATRNRGKVEEFNQFFNQLNINVTSLLDYPDFSDIEETGSTFEENALIKARSISKILYKPVLADDSGLEVSVLNNEPGIYSARYAGMHGNSELNNQKLLKQLKNIPLDKRQARFVCVLALVYPNGDEMTVRGTCDGLILDEMRGDNGFGYDPLFYIPNLNKTFGELTKVEKRLISHRGQALIQLERILNND